MGFSVGLFWFGLGFLWVSHYRSDEKGWVKGPKYGQTHLPNAVLAINPILRSSPLSSVSCQLPGISLTGPQIPFGQAIARPDTSWAENRSPCLRTLQ